MMEKEFNKNALARAATPTGASNPAITQIEGHEHYNTLIPLKTIKKENKHDEVRTVL